MRYRKSVGNGTRDHHGVCYTKIEAHWRKGYFRRHGHQIKLENKMPSVNWKEYFDKAFIGNLIRITNSTEIWIPSKKPFWGNWRNIWRTWANGSRPTCSCEGWSISWPLITWWHGSKATPTTFSPLGLENWKVEICTARSSEEVGHRKLIKYRWTKKFN